MVFVQIRAGKFTVVHAILCILPLPSFLSLELLILISSISLQEKVINFKGLVLPRDCKKINISDT